MCRDISFHSEIQVVTRDFQGIQVSPDVARHPDEMVHVTCEILPNYPIVVQKQGLHLVNMSWGVIPVYENDPKQRQIRRRNMVNAQSERILADKRSYWYKMRNNRCLIPTTGIFEHQKVAGFKNKIPYHVSEKGRDGFYVPALYQVSQEVDQETGELFKFPTFTMITRSSNDVMTWIHNDGDNKHRMPLFLTPEMEQAWIREDLSEGEMAEIFNYSIPEEKLDFYPVFSIRGGKPHPEGKLKDAFYDWGGKVPKYDGGFYGSQPQTALF
ncbi:SOS response-associated peptidase [Mucilaginibacter sp. SJ]|uniref:SOS response-associated peptidase n=1 Tax=Mucilaginibacter sp. SJ TaxID=3029053 RepID=UPI0023A98A2E|nr:SOS response-associated peptidase family protein [Mucilaginibacter sp. SJ]WEA01704.1 SOS response-associated peptidase family protein [Mucilaginibacter sp. SJ]